METAAPRSRSRRPNKNPMRAGLVVGIVLGKSGCSSVHALVSGASVAAAPSFVRGYSAPPPPRQSSALSLGRGRVRRRQGDCRLSATGGSGGAGDMDSSELYADMRRRLEEIRRGSAAGPPAEEDVSDLGLYQRREDGGGDGGGGNDGDFPKGGGGSAAGVKAYSAQEMKQRYYEAFWRARNLHKDAKFEGNSSSGAQDSSSASPPTTPPPPPEARQAAASRTTMLTPMAMKMFQSGSPAPAPAAADPAAAASSSVQGLTQMYYLVEEDQEEEAATAGVGATAAGSAGPAGGGPVEADGANVGRRAVKREPILPARQAGVMAAAAAAAAPAVGSPKAGNQQAVAFSSKEAAAAAVSETGAGAGAGADGMSFASAEPQGLTQVFYLDPEEEAEAAAALPVVPGRSFLRERLGVPGEVVQDLRQVELDHARLAMLAVLLSGAVGAGAGAGAGVYMNAHDGFSALADVARTPWLDPYVAGGILAAKALSEGDWRIGKGALAGWADRALSSLSNTGARVLRVGSGNEIRRLAVEMEVKHGRLALGAVVCAMAQQGMLTVAA